MKLLPLQPGGLRLLLDHDEAAMLDQLIEQLMQLMQSHSGTALDPDPLFASLEVGGTEQLPEDPALARLFPDAYEENSDASQFRRVTEQGLLNRKLQDALEVTAALGIRDEDVDPSEAVEVEVLQATLPAWVRTVTALRLAIAARIGLDEPSDHARLLADEDTRGTVLVFDWLAAILEAVLTIAHESDGASEPEDAPKTAEEREAEGDEGPH